MDGLGGSAPRLRGTGLRIGANTIPQGALAAAGFLRRQRSAAGLCLLLAACSAGPENGIVRAERQRRADALRTERESAQREHELLELELAEDRAALRPLRDAAATAAQRRREAMRALAHEEAQWLAAQNEVAAAEARVAAVQQDLERLRAVAAEVAEKELRLAALRERQAQLDVELAAAQRDVDQKIEIVQPRIDALRARLSALSDLAAQIDAAMPPTAPVPTEPTAPAATPNTGKEP